MVELWPLKPEVLASNTNLGRFSLLFTLLMLYFLLGFSALIIFFMLFLYGCVVVLDGPASSYPDRP